MKRGPAKRTVERRKRSRSTGGKSTKAVSERAASGSSPKASSPKASSNATTSKKSRGIEIREVHADECQHCSKSLEGKDDRALYVEEEVGRVFCSEACIAAYFTPEINRLEKEFFKRLAPSDLNGEERENLAHLRWITLQEPDEVWREKTLTGDHRYTLIAEFKPGNRRIWCVCICLFLRGEPSFLFIAFPTRNASMVNHYRRGERVEWVRPQPAENTPAEQAAEGFGPGEEPRSDRLASEWTEDETFLAKMSRERRADDIPAEDFEMYHGCLEETLEGPDEVWSVRLGPAQETKIYHFIRAYPQDTPRPSWFIIVAREVPPTGFEQPGDDGQIEILDAFPTNDETLMEHFRQGEQEVGQVDATKSAARVVH